MARVIKRYGSRKLYDTQESRYVALADVAKWIREGIQIQVIDNASSEDVTTSILTQVISEEGRRGTAFWPNELLHDMIRAGGDRVSSGVKQIQQRLDLFVSKSLDRITPVREAREEMEQLKQRLSELETSLTVLETTKDKAKD